MNEDNYITGREKYIGAWRKHIEEGKDFWEILVEKEVLLEEEMVGLLEGIKDLISPDYYNFLFIHMFIGWEKIIKANYWGEKIDLRGKEKEVKAFLEASEY